MIEKDPDVMIDPRMLDEEAKRSQYMFGSDLKTAFIPVTVEDPEMPRGYIEDLKNEDGSLPVDFSKPSNAPIDLYTDEAMGAYKAIRGPLDFSLESELKKKETLDIHDNPSGVTKMTGTSPRVATGAVIINLDGKVLMCRRNSGPESYIGKMHLFGGKVDIGETMYDAIVREIREEANIDLPEQAWRMDLLGIMEEIEPDCEDITSIDKRIYHWVSTVWAFWVKSDEFQNLEPHKHLEMGWYDIATLDRADIAPSALKSLMLAGLIDNNLNQIIDDKLWVEEVN